ncbi:hypothetical protein LIR37_18060 [Flavonifractor plautii]|uniref:hypothetical protein n=1 Tax=Flavonifractor plautii TaxID=292800 RepID=UPI001D02F2D4|nr:hypothetical protein [Flavonifractor plautii]MCB5856259.1 hypothetical protein [Flavonifractor plautii]
MERLTYWCDNGHGGGKWFVAIDAEGGEDYGPHVDRLAAYEETGLEPEDLKRAFNEDDVLKLAGQALGITPERLRELAQAHKENRVLPEGSGWFVTCNGKKLTVVMDIEAALRREQKKEKEDEHETS